MKYTIDDSFYDEGASAEFFLLRENKKLGFKQFRNKKIANNAYKTQKLLNKFGLAPRVYGGVRKLKIKDKHIDTYETNWGYITERAKLVNDKVMSKRLRQIQTLVNKIHKKTKLKFWDCHYYNMGYIKRKNKAKLVCIDTGPESFDSSCNAWGFSDPGPKCNYCNKYQCYCSSS